MRIALVTLVACLLGCSAAAQEPPAPHDDSAGPGAPAAGEVETMIRAGEYLQAIEKADALRAASGDKHAADADSEYWAAKAEVLLHRDDAAKARYQLVMRTYPGTPRAGDAAVEEAVIGVDVPRGHVASHETRDAAAAAARAVDKIGASLNADPATAAHAWFVAGNAWRIAEDDASARRDYEAAIKLVGGKYPDKAKYMLGIIEARAMDIAGARAVVEDCAARTTGGQQFECRKELERWAGVGSAAPPLSVETWVRDEPAGTAPFQGRVTLVWFFATWCPHCQAAEMPDMAALVKRVEGKPFRIVAITKNGRDQTTDTVKAFVADPQWHVTYPVGVDADGKTTAAFHSPAIPSAVLVDKKGVIRWAGHPGMLSDAAVDALLAE